MSDTKLVAKHVASVVAIGVLIDAFPPPDFVLWQIQGLISAIPIMELRAEEVSEVTEAIDGLTTKVTASRLRDGAKLSIIFALSAASDELITNNGQSSGSWDGATSYTAPPPTEPSQPGARS